MSLDAVETRSPQKPADAVSLGLVADAYNPKSQLSTTSGDTTSGDSGGRTAVVSNGQLGFGDVAALYTSKSNSTADPAENTSTTTQSTPAKIDFSNVNASGVDQAGVGDCFFESALASVANSSGGQAAIENMIKANDDGSYTVTFPGDSSHPVTVTSNDLNANQAVVQDSAPWANIIETAFMKYDNAEQYGQGLYAWQGQGTPYLGKVEFADYALQLLTGKSAATDSLATLNSDSELTIGSASNSDVARSLTNAFKDGDAVTASTGPSSNAPGSALVSDHVYSVLSYDSTNGNVIVRNPWGSSDNPTLQNTIGASVDGMTNLGDGKLEMSLATFTSHFSDLNISGQNPAQNDLENVVADARATDQIAGQTVNDLERGQFSATGSDLSQLAAGGLQVLSDQAYATTDLIERQAITDFEAVVPVVNDVYLWASSLFS